MSTVHRNLMNVVTSRPEIEYDKKKKLLETVEKDGLADNPLFQELYLLDIKYTSLSRY